MVISFMGAGAANPAISYALSHAAPVVAMIWGVFVWKEFKDAPKGTCLLYTSKESETIGCDCVQSKSGSHWGRSFVPECTDSTLF